MKIKDYIVYVTIDEYQLTDLFLENNELPDLLANNLILNGRKLISGEYIRSWHIGNGKQSNYYLFDNEYKAFLPLLKKYLHDKEFNNKFDNLIKD